MEEEYKKADRSALWGILLILIFGLLALAHFLMRPTLLTNSESKYYTQIEQ